MKYSTKIIRTPVNVQPEFHMVELFEEAIEYERNFRLPFNSICLCDRENPEDPSWIELREKRTRYPFQENTVSFLTCDTPMRIRYTTVNRHFCIHFRYELFPGVDLFFGLKEWYILNDKTLPKKIKSVFAEPDPLKRLTRAEAVAMEVILSHWPKNLPIDQNRIEQFSGLLQYVNNHLDSRIGISEMAAQMGWSEGYFSRMFRSVFHITPKQYLVREIYARAVSLLNDPQKSIKEISETLKFSSEFNFSRFIRHYSGHSPSELRRWNLGPIYVRK